MLSRSIPVFFLVILLATGIFAANGQPAPAAAPIAATNTAPTTANQPENLVLPDLTAPSTETTRVDDFESKTLFFGSILIAFLIALAIVAAGGALAMGKTISTTVEASARQPEIAGKLQTLMFIGLALIESLVIYVLAIGILLMYANPFVKFFIKN